MCGRDRPAKRGADRDGVDNEPSEATNMSAAKGSVTLVSYVKHDVRGSHAISMRKYAREVNARRGVELESLLQCG